MTNQFIKSTEDEVKAAFEEGNGLFYEWPFFIFLVSSQFKIVTVPHPIHVYFNPAVVLVH